MGMKETSGVLEITMYVNTQAVHLRLIHFVHFTIDVIPQKKKTSLRKFCLIHLYIISRNKHSVLHMRH